MTDLKNCPFCGKKPNLRRWFDQDGCWFIISCPGCGTEKMFLGEQVAIEKWNTRPAEDALKARNKELVETMSGMEKTIGRAEKVLGERNLLAAEVERLKAVIAEIGAMTLTGADDVEDFIFILCKDTVSDEAIKQAYRKHLENDIAKMALGTDTNVPANDTDTNVGSMEKTK